MKINRKIMTKMMINPINMNNRKRQFAAGIIERNDINGHDNDAKNTCGSCGT